VRELEEVGSRERKMEVAREEGITENKKGGLDSRERIPSRSTKWSDSLPRSPHRRQPKRQEAPRLFPNFGNFQKNYNELPKEVRKKNPTPERKYEINNSQR
jgi:hypothetical protein